MKYKYIIRPEETIEVNQKYYRFKNIYIIGSITENYKMSCHPSELIFLRFKFYHDSLHSTLRHLDDFFYISFLIYN